MKNISEIQKLIQSGENEKLEFKSSFNNELIETLVAFANTFGGKIIAGINPAGMITGISLNPESIQNWVNEIIEFFNPGKLYGGITIDDLLSGNYSSKTRNKLIAKAFKEVGLIERYGSGIKRIVNICEEYGVKQPKFEEIFNGFRVVLFKEKTDVTKDVTKNVTKEKRIIKILELIKSNPSITTSEIALRLELTPRTVLRDIDQLKNENRLRRVGGRKKGKWIILGND